MGDTRNHQPIAWLPASWTLPLLTCFLVVSGLVSQHVPESYMDEPFHVPMAQQYCRGDLISWDPKITTFPGLYYLGAVYAWLSSVLLSYLGASLDVTCSGPYLRSLNALLAVVTVQLAYALSTELQRQDWQNACSTDSACEDLDGTANGAAHQSPAYACSSGPRKQGQPSGKATKGVASVSNDRHGRALGVALVIGLLPTQLFFAFLFYTDVPALLFLLLTELMLVRGATKVAAAAGAAATCVRQTNAVWVTFLTGAAMLSWLQQQQHLETTPGRKRSAQQTMESSASSAKKSSGAVDQRSSAKQQQQQQQPLLEVFSLLNCAWQHRWSLLSRFGSLLLVPVAFCAFVLWNGSITLGDKEAHAPSAHLMQPLYFGLFCLINAWPLLLQERIVKPLVSSFRSRRLLWVAGLAGGVAVGCFLAARYSLAHPYLLADNRHYTFYIWRKVVNCHWAAQYCLVPFYLLGWLLLFSGLCVTQHWIWVAAFVVSCCVTLVPAWLIEFRYFTAPFALAVLHIPAPRNVQSMIIAAAFVVVNAMTLYVFVAKPYTWGDGSVARFMW